ncbi:MAG: helix-turn-helix transcriptional regulator [Deltaproteobacteria bacterium]|nr:helix-turn-helix transcriptional regulator [Deltaproteobacteria bacterium]
MLLDPTTDDPEKHLDYVPELTNGRERWTVQGKTVRGRKTVEVFHLDEDDERFNTHLALLRDLLEDLEAARERSPEALRRLWQRKVKLFVATDPSDPEARPMPFPALSHAYLRHHFGRSMDMYELELPALGQPGATARSEALPVARRPYFDELDDDTRLEVDRLGRRPKREQTRALLRRLIAIRPWTVTQFAELLPQSPATLAGHLRALADAGELDFDGQRASAKPRAKARRARAR